jgi:hypothetical protein
MVYVLHLSRQLDDRFRGLTWAKRLFPEADEKLVSLSLVGAKLDFDIPGSCAAVAVTIATVKSSRAKSTAKRFAAMYP